MPTSRNTLTPDAAHREDAGDATRAAPRRSRRRRAGYGVLITLLALILVVVGDAALVVIRIERFDLPALSGGPPGTTWVIVGSDNRSYRPTEGRQIGLGDSWDGDHADAVLVVRQAEDGTVAFSVPRDLYVTPAGGWHPDRLSVTLFEAPGAFTTALCQGLGIRTDHLVIVRMDSFVALVDAVGGVEVQVPYPYRDTATGIDIPTAGTVALNGDDALALVRSRYGEQLIDGSWVADSSAEGAEHRVDTTGALMGALADRVPEAADTPWGIHRLAWAATSGLAVDSGTSLPALLSLKDVDVATVDSLPVRRSQNADIIAYADEATTAALARAGFRPGACQVDGVPAVSA